MNLAGKILIVLTMVMSLLFMAFAMMVYASHKDWKEIIALPADQATGGKEKGLRFQRDEEKAKAASLQEQLDKLKQTLEIERQNLRARLAAAETARVELNAQLNGVEAQYDKLKVESEQRLATLKGAQEKETAERTEVEGLREEIGAAQKARDEAFAQVVQMTDELQQARSQWERLRALNEDLVNKATAQP